MTRQVETLELSEPLTQKLINRCVEDQFERGIDRAFPMWRMIVLTGSDKAKCAVIFCFDHCLGEWMIF